MDDYVSSGFFWFTVALINAGLAQQKNRSRWAWFLVSLLLGPPATVMIVIWPAPVPVAPPMSCRGGWRNLDE
ncbi:hypothetical protein C4K88_03295 [Arthrobacter pityocampae]|uniref:Uncharacterized protein n=1 Tax=Arthrobacter pityocampae TaxID=547334 RepID=A0A2S5J267_9MICC|nr:hypothetical protein [Arthrobacter pityocampae]PPB50898.1 hypothetical protein C4K88_03295 [Arthrobacter pityocampae]